MPSVDSPFQLQNQKQFDLSHGFLPTHDPITHLTAELKTWDEFAYALPKLLCSQRFRDFVKALPEFNVNAIKTGEQRERAMLILSYVAHAYVWLGGNHPATHLPAIIAKPWYEIATQLGRPPILSYASYALYNWRRFDVTAPIAIDNIALLQNFLGGVDEEWFILIHIDIEQKAAQGLRALLPAEQAINNNDNKALAKQLNELRLSLAAMQKTMERMPEFCDPYIYYNRVRPYIHGWKDNPSLPQGLIYEGVTQYHDKPQRFKGETGAQSGIIPLFDAALKIEHENTPLKQHLDEMRCYMPPEHQAYLTALEKSPSIRQYVKQQHYPELTELYNAAIELIGEFRATHLKYAAQYIEKQKQTSEANSTAVGTGGTPFMAYLKKHRDETMAFLL